MCTSIDSLVSRCFLRRLCSGADNGDSADKKYAMAGLNVSLQNEGRKTDLKWLESLILLVGMKTDKQHLSDLLEQIDS